MPDGKTQLEIILDRVEKFMDRVEKDDFVKVVRILLKVVKIAFRFVPMKDDEKDLFRDITTGVGDFVDLVDQPNP